MKSTIIILILCLSIAGTGVAEPDAQDKDAVVSESSNDISKTLLVSGAAAGLIYGAWLLDSRLRDDIQEWRTDDTGKRIKGFGDKGTPIEAYGRSAGVLPVCGTFLAGGLILWNQTAMNVGIIGAVSWFLDDTAVRLLKKSIGRRRPGEDNAGEFRSSGDSMPSGHTATAFCMSAVIATEYNSPYISVLSYGTAAAVGFSRLYRDKHWTSDVVAGAVLGIAIGKASCWVYHKITSDLFLAATGNSIIIYKKF